jgi:hypothetical protein
MKKTNQKLLWRRSDGYSALRVYHRRSYGKKSPRLLIKCGDCDNKFKIYYDPDREDLEIAGVLGSVGNWREILLPLLKKPRKAKHGATTKELDCFVRATDRRIARERKAGKIKVYSGDLEGDLAG